MTTSDSISTKETFLSSLLLELIEILRDRQGETWTAIAQIATGKSATIAIDDTRLFLQVDQDLAVTVSEAEADAINDFESNGITLKNVIFGRSSLDKSVASGKIFIRASFGDLLKIRSIVASVLADTANEPRLASLWERFDQEWN
ncbi:MAG: hypothetical protein AUK48_03600 [Oscillatoriales cyanobacterium CG2_30_44_21]|nr:MAG: hypothetical protein AUK48_03600 [Oscillatoriales cyanobacterium CG2_30_44_21]